jgi:hypothetical protein
MTLFWIGSLVLLVVILPVVIYLLSGVLNAAKSIVPSEERIAKVTAAASKDLDAVPLLLTTQERVKTTIEVVANYGGSLDVIVDDAPAEESRTTPTPPNPASPDGERAARGRA